MQNFDIVGASGIIFKILLSLQKWEGEAEGQCDRMRAWCQCLLVLQLSCVVLPVDQQTGRILNTFTPGPCSDFVKKLNMRYSYTRTADTIVLIFHNENPAEIVYDMIYLLTAIGLSSGGSTHLHTNTT
jgi:hypothetical protein